MQESSRKFVDELIAAIGEDGAVELLEEAAKFRNVRSRYLKGDVEGLQLLIETVGSWEQSDEMPVFVHKFVPFVREMSVFTPAARIAAAPGVDEKHAAEINAAVALLRSLMSGKLGQQLLFAIEGVSN